MKLIGHQLLPGGRRSPDRGRCVPAARRDHADQRHPHQRRERQLRRRSPQPGRTAVGTYKVTATFANGKVYTFPQNAADPNYEFYAGTDHEALIARTSRTRPLRPIGPTPARRPRPTNGSGDRPARSPLTNDPRAAFSGTKVFGMDLGKWTTDGVYPPAARAACRARSSTRPGMGQVHLQYRRQLNVESGRGGPGEHLRQRHEGVEQRHHRRTTSTRSGASTTSISPRRRRAARCKSSSSSSPTPPTTSAVGTSTTSASLPRRVTAARCPPLPTAVTAAIRRRQRRHARWRRRFGGNCGRRRFGWNRGLGGRRGQRRRRWFRRDRRRRGQGWIGGYRRCKRTRVGAAGSAGAAAGAAGTRRCRGRRGASGTGGTGGTGGNGATGGASSGAGGSTGNRRRLLVPDRRGALEPQQLRRVASGPPARRSRTPKAAPLSAARRLVRLVSFSALVLCIGACAGSRKGADAGGGASNGGPSGGPGTTAVASGSPSGAPSPGPNATAQAPSRGGEGEPCGELTCPPGKTCITFYGIAGPAGPKFHACEVKCTPGGKPACPPGQSCTIIADGPGQVCRPSHE